MENLTEREKRINEGKVWQVYPSGDPDNTLYEAGSRAACHTYLRKKGLTAKYNSGAMRVGQVIWEAEVKEI